MLTKTFQASGVFARNFEAYQEKQYRVISNQGGSRSGKSYGIMQLLIILALSTPGTEISVCSPSLPHLKRGSRKDFIKIMDDMGIYNEDSFNRTDQLYTFYNGSTLEFFSADDPSKLRGPSRMILFINEANLIPYESFVQLSMRTKNLIFLDYNPSDLDNWIYEASDRETSKLIVSTYLDNIENLSTEQVREIESLKNADLNLWNVYGLGQRGAASELVLTHWKQCETVPDGGEVIYGLDFGYNHPTALIKVTLYDDNIYAEEIIYQSKLTTSDLVEKMASLRIEDYSRIYCDSAMPGTIEELYRQGFNVSAAKKDVLEGLRSLKSKPLYISKESTNLIKELRSYRWKLDSSGKPYDEPVKFMDDAIDALRYAVFSDKNEYKATWVAM